MPQEVHYTLMYKKNLEIITLDDFPSVYAALDYCRQEGIEDPIEIRRIQTQDERILDRSQIEKLLNAKNT